MKVPVIRKKFFSDRVFLERRLPASGKILVSVGDEVKPFDLVGKAEMGLRKETAPLAKILGVGAAEAPAYLLKREGQSFLRGEVLALKSSLFGLIKRKFTAPFPGVVAKIDAERGEVVLKTLPECFKLTAGAGGKVLKVIPKEAVLLRISATTVRGVWAAGKDVEGELVVVGAANTPLSLVSLTPELSGKIVVGGSFASAEAVEKAAAIGVRGVVVGGINYPRRKDFLGERDFALLVTEGFGELPLEPSCWSYFKSVEARHTLLLPGRKGLLIPETSPHDGSKKVEGGEFVELKVGDKVGIFSWPFFAEVGRVAAIGAKPEKFPSGITARAAAVKLLETGEEVRVPLRNVGVVV